MQTLMSSELSDLVAKVEAGQRLSREDGYRLYASHDLMTVGYMADLVRRRTAGDFVFFTGMEESGEATATLRWEGAMTGEAWIDGLIGLRTQQDEAARFLCFASSPNGKLSGGASTGIDDMKQLAVARILLDNIPHIRASWADMGVKMAQASLSFGVDDLGAMIPDGAAEMAYLIRQAGRIPVEGDAAYNHLKVWHTPS